MELSRILKRSTALARDGESELAITLLESLATEHKRDPSVWQTLAYVQDCKGDKEAAIRDISRAIELSDNMEPAYFYQRGIYLFQCGALKKAIRDFTTTLELSHHYKSLYYVVSAYFFRADSYVRLKLFSKAKDDCRRVPDGFSTWTDRLRRKEDLLREINNHFSRQRSRRDRSRKKEG